MAFSSCIWLTISLSGPATPRTLAKPPSSGFTMPALVPGCHLLIESRRVPTELWEIAKVTMCIFTSEWPWVGTMGVFKASQTLQ